jgi:predicted nucleic acid-binding protein
LSLLLDTNVVSELASRRPNVSVSAWLRTLNVGDAFLSVATVAEICRGIGATKDENNRERLADWYTAALLPAFGSRILPLDFNTAERAGVIGGRAQRAGRRMEAIDAVIAATAELHGLTVVTRNVRDFEVWGGPMFNPWSLAD